MVGQNTVKIGLRGEMLVHEILEGSELTNDIHKDTHLPYDLTWEGIKVNVKTTSITAPSTDGACSFGALKKKIHHNGVIAVFVYISIDKEYFWVEKYSAKMRTYFRINESLSRAELPDAIIKANAKKAAPIEHETVLAVYVNRQLKQELIEIAEKLTKDLEMKVTIHMAIHYLVNKFREANGDKLTD